jgi:oligoendopeptidase F
MAAAPPTIRELDGYREEADRFQAELMEEYYLHLAGIKPDLELEPIYERHAELTTLDAARSIGAAAADDRRTTELWRFACDGYMGNLTKKHVERINELEATLKVVAGDDEVGYRMVRPTIANTEDRAKRRALDEGRCELEDEHLNPIYLETTGIVSDATRALGSATYYDLHLRFGFRLPELAEQCRAFLDSTERLYETSADRLFRARAGVALEGARRWDVPRVFRAPEWDPQFPSDRLVPALETTLDQLGIDLRSQPNVILDVEQRDNKSPRAFCAPIVVPDRVALVIQPIGGVDDWRALFHEAGHTEHFANTSRDLAMEERRLGDNAVTEGWAFLFEHLVHDPAWLSRRLDFPRASEFITESMTGLLYLVRRYCAKLLYEIELHQAADATTMKSRYVELLGDALKIEPSPTDWLADVDGGFYVTEYLRAWALESQVSFYLRERFGNAWFTSRDAGVLLRELWSLGQKPTADELLAELTGAEIEMEAVAEKVREHLGPLAR